MGPPHDQRYERQGKTTRRIIYKNDNLDNNSAHQHRERRGGIGSSQLENKYLLAFGRNLNYPN